VFVRIIRFAKADVFPPFRVWWLLYQLCYCPFTLCPPMGRTWVRCQMYRSYFLLISRPTWPHTPCFRISWKYFFLSSISACLSVSCGNFVPFGPSGKGYFSPTFGPFVCSSCIVQSLVMSANCKQTTQFAVWVSESRTFSQYIKEISHFISIGFEI